ncbi:MAG: multicopper oxidase family protein [Myxococcaceae bacterium]
MPITRRQLLCGAGLAAAWAARSRAVAAAGASRVIHPVLRAGMRPGQPGKLPLHPDSLAHFVDALPIPEVAQPLGTRRSPSDASQQLAHYRLSMRELEVQVHRDMKPTRCWSFGAGVPGPTFDVKSGKGVVVEWVNALPARHLFASAIDHNLCGAGADLPDVRTVTHVHGSRVPAQSDGYPDAWFTPGNSRLFHYPNHQDAATLWYHDHASGLERLNQYAGLFGAFLLRDESEAALGLPSGRYEVPLVLCDRLFDESGQLHYPTSGVADAPWVSEVYGDAHLVNGKLFPYLDVEPRLYRFRVLNASNSRFYFLSLSNGQSLTQVGSDQGLLSAPVTLQTLTLAPAERADILIDFGAQRAAELLLKSQSFVLMQFKVSGAAARSAPKPPGRLRPIQRIAPSAAVRTRRLTLDQYMDPKTKTMVMLLNATFWRAAVTEKPTLGSVEIWELMNTTEDIHPIHLHLVRFQLLDRQHFDVDSYNSHHGFKMLGAPIPPEPNEMGWKDTIQAYPGMLTRIIIPFHGYPGRYVWHCHVLEHAANEMMRPFDVVPAPQRASAP